MKTAEETLELYFGSDFYQLRESGILPFILAAMEEYKAQPLDKLIESAFKAGRSKQSWASFMEEYKSQSSEKEKEVKTLEALQQEWGESTYGGSCEEYIYEYFTNPPKV